jgi:hypothetical protein
MLSTERKVLILQVGRILTTDNSASETLSDLRHRSSLRVCELESGGQLGAKNAVFRREVLISQKEFLELTDPVT